MLSDDHLHVVALSALLILQIIRERRNKRAKRRRLRKCKRQILNISRQPVGSYKKFLAMKENKEDPELFFKYTRMSVVAFNDLLKLVIKRMSRKEIHPFHIGAEEKLAITLQYLSQGVTIQRLASRYKLSITTVHKIISEMCKLIWKVLFPLYLPKPTSNTWRRIASGFSKEWHFPNCIGAVDAKYLTIQATHDNGSSATYKKPYNIVIFAACDANYIFRLVDIGAYGSQNGVIFRQSNFGHRLNKDQLDNVPSAGLLPNTKIKMPFVFIGDEAFPMKSHSIIRPYLNSSLTFQQKIYNYRHFRARRCIENAFGVLVARWKILQACNNVHIDHIEHVIKAVIVLHNFCKIKDFTNEWGENVYCSMEYTDETDGDDGLWRQDAKPLQSVGRLSTNHTSQEVYKARDMLSNYFMSDNGKVPWYEEKVLSRQ